MLLRNLAVRCLALVAATIALGVTGYLLIGPAAIDPIAWQPPPNPGRTGPYSPNSTLAGVRLAVGNIGLGPEDVAKGRDGWLYSGLQDGRIVRFRPANGQIETVVNTGGRPLGMQFDANGNLIVADAFRGLLSVTPWRQVVVLTNKAGGAALRFTNDLDIASDGTVWFSDASQRFDQHHWDLDFLEGRATGRLLTYNPRTGQTAVRLDGLRFANGVALGPDEAFVLVSETLGARISRIWLKGPKAGRHDVFVDALPAYPDNLSYNGRGTFWVALPNPRVALLDSLAPAPALRKVIARIPRPMRDLVSRVSYGWVIGLDDEGRVVSNLQNPAGSYGTITSVNEIDHNLYFGSLAMSSVGEFPLP